ncbi:RDD family protein [Pseudovibrio axinellae]|uniref:RDD family protein n=1 Tax=Pseudovibrio axinellae TaxID=989403 RepID=A0A165WPG0_9HYPH|nr:RDD family protein [Pseudovibrio axinellae]KZL16761.1 RDD family protein [Pseudovibrio axinellae]SEQ75713.1 Uncharacterized membrane protein YckC, RDD family [Pseudovibrio axinellae]
MSQDVSTPPSTYYDPYLNPQLFDGVRTKRVFACLIDIVAITILSIIAYFVVGFLGILTLGLAWLLFPAIWPLVALAYTAFSLGGFNSATPGMRAFGVEMRLNNGSRPYPLFAAIHALLFYFSVTVLSPFVLLVSLFSDQKRLLHDILLGAVIMNSPVDSLHR